jgi:hypothetical protein
MKDSSTTQQPASEPAVERPAWRFSGRRGTPVHLRDQAPATLPPEIRQAIVQMARERSGEATTPTGGTSIRTTTGPNLSGALRQSPPVAGAPLPVERRSRERTSEPVVTTSPIGPALPPDPTPALEATPALDATSEATPAPRDTPPATEVPAVAAETPSAPELAADVEDQAATTTGSETEAADPAPSTEPATAAVEPAKSRTRGRDRSKSKSRAAAKVRAKARAKARRDAAADSAPKRRVLAADRVVEPVEAAIEPPMTEPVTATPATAAPAAPSPDLSATVEATASTHEPVTAIGGPDADATDIAPIADAAVWTTTTTADQQSEDDTWNGPSPSVATDAAGQAAWELGRLPILMTPSNLHADADAYLASTIHDAEPDLASAWDAVAASAAPTVEPLVGRSVEPEAAPVDEPETASDPEPSPMSQPTPALEPAVASAPEPARMSPMHWRTPPTDPTPAPIEPLDLPHRAPPATIARLRQPLHAADEQPWASRARVREEAAPGMRSVASRRHVEDRRRDLESVLDRLAAIGGTPPRP